MQQYTHKNIPQCGQLLKKMLEFPNFACYQVFSKRVAFFQNTLCSSAVPTSLDGCHFVIYIPANVFTSFLPKRPPKRERERFLGFSGPNKSGERKAEGSGLRDARTADPPLQQVSMQPWKTILLFLQRVCRIILGPPKHGLECLFPYLQPLEQLWK